MRDEVGLRWMGMQASESRALGPLLALRRRVQGEPALRESRPLWALELYGPRGVQVVEVAGARRHSPAASSPRDMAITWVKVIPNAVASTRPSAMCFDLRRRLWQPDALPSVRSPPSHCGRNVP